MKTALRIVVISIILFFSLKISPYGYLIKGVKGAYFDGHTSAHIYDRKHFSQREIPSLNPQPFEYAEEKWSLNTQTREVLEGFDTRGLVVLKDHKVVLEEYWEDHNAQTISNSFSVAKSIITLLVQIAIQDGYIGSWDEPITQYIPEYKIPEGVSIPTLRHFSTMTAGMHIKEDYKNPFSKTAKLYYHDDVAEVALSTPPGKFEAGTEWEYQSACTQMLGIALTRAVSESISSYANRELFTKLGFETDATWHLDHEGGIELAFSSLNAATLDFAKIGEFALNHGRVGEFEVVDSTFLSMATQGFKSPRYGHGYWIYPETQGKIYGSRGMLGQIIMVVPEHNLVIARTGQTSGPKWIEDFNQVEKTLLEQVNEWTNN